MGAIHILPPTPVPLAPKRSPYSDLKRQQSRIAYFRQKISTLPEEPKGRLGVFFIETVRGRQAIPQASLEIGPERPEPSILVVEDEVLLRLDLADQLRRAGFNVIEADSGDEARTLLATEIDVDLMLTDIRMPGEIDGLQLAKWTRRHAPRTKIVIVSAYIDPYWDVPVDAVFAKPVRIERLLTTLRQLLPPTEQAGSGNR